MIGCRTFVQFSFFTIGLRKPDFWGQGDRLELEMEGTPRNSIQVDGEWFKHPGGDASLVVAWKSQINLLRYEG